MPSKYEELSQPEVIDLLRKFREGNERRSEEVCEMWQKAFDKDIGKLGNEKYVILEQLIFALLDCHQYALASFCIATLSNEFPGSLRVMRYQAALLEAEEKYDEAMDMLEELVKADHTNAAARKRFVAHYKARGMTNLAIIELVSYLKKFMCDVEGWQELCDLYQQVGEMSRAAFCADEILLHQPHNHLAHQRRADIAYTLGGVENMELAKTYYSQALKLNPDNMRALLGLVLVTNNLLVHYKSSGNGGKRKDTWKLNQWAHARAAKQPAAVPLEQMLLSLSITE